ncbi:Hypothetical protein FKW44_018107 [Caligus rogercresseyi]|uniref:Uncharacterized protein n=1 Tax=Caligus rogercresseyi TaxID=217165 RepID=A0A7T8GTX1_CALRO|nr:Hypothetical protein FKW44_018107 [Caligus rogercresseyi]
MISEGVQTNGILKTPPPYYPRHPQSPAIINSHHQQKIPGYKLQIYEIDTLPPDDAETQSPSFSPSNLIHPLHSPKDLGTGQKKTLRKEPIRGGDP